MRVLALLLIGLLISCHSAEQKQQTAVTDPTAQPPEIAEPGEEKDPPSIVYYQQVNIGSLAPVPVNLVRHQDPAIMAKHLIDLLSIKPEDPNYEPIWPSSTYIRELFLLGDGTIVVDFHQSFVSSLSAGAALEEQMIVSLVFTLLDNFEAYKWVRILVDGQPQETFLGHVDIENPLDRATKLYTVTLSKGEDDEISVEDLDASGSKNQP